MERAEYDALYDQIRANDTLIQDREEFWALISLVKALNPVRILEIGVERGGTSLFWGRLVGPKGSVFGMDFFNSELIDLSSINFIPITGNSTDPLNIHIAQELAPYDFIFIDGDHSYEGCKADWENYKGMIKPGGIIAFHDLSHPPIKKVFSEIDMRKEAFLYSFGIGVVFCE